MMGFVTIKQISKLVVMMEEIVVEKILINHIVLIVNVKNIHRYEYA